MASAHGHLRGSTQVEWAVTDWSARTEERTIVLEAARVLTGRVIAADTRAPVTNAKLQLGWAEPWNGTPHDIEWTDPEGEFCARYAGERQLLVSADGFVDRGLKLDPTSVDAGQPLSIALERDTLTHAFEAIVLDPLGEPDRNTTGLRFRSESQRLERPPQAAVFAGDGETTLRAVHGGPLANDLVLADGMQHDVTSLGGPAGVFRVRWLDAGTYHVDVIFRDANALDLGRVEIPPKGERLVLKQEAPTGIAGVLRGADEMLWLSVYDHLDRPTPQHCSQTLAGKDHRFRFVGLPVREDLRLVVRRGDLETVLIDRFTLAPGEMREGLELTLPAIEGPSEATVTGVVTDALSDEPVAGARVMRAVERMGRPKEPEPEGAVTDANGRFALEHMPAREVFLHVSKEGYYDSSKRFAPIPETVALKLLPRDPDRLLASSRFTRVEVRLELDGGAIPPDCALQLLALSADNEWRALDLLGDSAQALAATDHGFEGLLPAPVSAAYACGERSWILPERLRATVISGSTGLTGMGEAPVNAGGITRIDVRLGRTEVHLAFRDVRSGKPLSTDGRIVTLATLSGAHPIEMTCDGAGAIARGVPAGRYEIAMRLESGRGRSYQLWPATLDVAEGARSWEVQVLQRKHVRIRVLAPDGSELRPPRAQPGEPMPDDPNAVTLVIDPIQVMGETIALAKVNRAGSRTGPGGEIEPPYYWAVLPLDESATLAVESAGRRSDPQTVLVTEDTRELTFRLPAP
jgi:hypothetical protein